MTPVRRAAAAPAVLPLLVLLAPLLAVVPASPAAADQHGSPHAAHTARHPARHATGTAPADEDAGLAVEITSLSPSALQPGEPLELTGTVTNDDVHGWRELNAYLVISPEPVTTSGALARVAASPAETYISDRITNLRRFDSLGPLPTGESTGFRLQLPYRALPISGGEGIYTVGVQVLATDVDESRQLEARARTFLPLVDATRAEPPARVDLGLVWPLRAPVLRRSDGVYLHGDDLRQSMATGGQLRRLTDLAVSADVPLSTVADPALLDAAQDFAEGRYGPPVRSAGPGDEGTEEPPDTDAAGPEAAGDDGETTGTDGAVMPTVTSPAAREWMADVTSLVAGRSGWLTRYGEPDEATVATGPPRLEAAVTRATDATAEDLITGVPGIAALPVDGVVQQAALAAVAREEGHRLAIVSPQQLDGWRAAQGAALSVATSDGVAPVLVADPDLSAGGPATDDPQSALQMRQRLLAETLLLSLAAGARGDETTSAVFMPPSDWNPGISWPAAGFFSGLRTPWLHPTPVRQLLRRAADFGGTVLEPDEVPLPGTADRDEGADEGADDNADPTLDPLLALDLTTASAQLVRRSRTLVRLLRGDPDLARWYDGSAALGMSSYARDDGERRLGVTRHTVSDLGRQLDQVSIEGPPFVTLSSSRGRFGVTITNNLDRPVTVGVRVAAGTRGLEFDAGDPVTVGPGERQTVTVDTKVGDNRVSAAQAYLVTRHGERFGEPLKFSLRTSVVGVVIWAVLAVAGLILVVAIIRRIVRRVRGDDSPAPT